MGEPKEPGFFTEHYERGWSWYEACFQPTKDTKAIGDGSADYSKRTRYPRAVTRIAKNLPDVRLIYIVRHPMQRIESAWKFSCKTGGELRPFIEAMKARPEKYVDTTDYLAQIDAYREHYSDDRILVLFLSDMARDPDGVRQRCFEFLDVDTGYRVLDKTVHHASTDMYSMRWHARLMKRIPGLGSLRRAIPPNLRKRLRPLFSRRYVPDEPQWTRELFEMVRSRLADNSREFLVRYGKAPDFWEFDPAACMSKTRPSAEYGSDSRLLLKGQEQASRGTVT